MLIFLYVIIILLICVMLVGLILSTYFVQSSMFLCMCLVCSVV